jgi:hypothetical protein
MKNQILLSPDAPAAATKASIPAAGSAPAAAATKLNAQVIAPADGKPVTPATAPVPPIVDKPGVQVSAPAPAATVAVASVQDGLGHLTRENIITRFKAAQQAIADAGRPLGNASELAEFCERHKAAILKKIVAGLTRDQAIISIRVQLEHDLDAELFSLSVPALIERTRAAEKKAAATVKPASAAALKV